MSLPKPVFPLPWGNRNDYVRCMVCKTYLALHVGNYQDVRIYRCTNPECYSLIGETGNGVPTRSLLVDSAILRTSINRLNAWWTGEIPEPVPAKWEPPAQDDEPGFYWQY